MLTILCVPQSGPILRTISSSVVAIPLAQPLPLSHLPHLMQPSATISGVPITTPSAPSAMALAMSYAVRIPPEAIRVTWSRMPSSQRNLWTLGMAYSMGIAMFFFAISGAAPVPP